MVFLSAIGHYGACGSLQEVFIGREVRPTRCWLYHDDTWLSMVSLVNCTKDSHHGIEVRHDLSLICLLDIYMLQLIPESH